MATMNRDMQGTQGQPGQQQKGQGIGSPISNEAYNVVAALHEKLQGLEAYRKYSHDANPDLWKRLTDAELQSVEMLIDALEQLVRDGKFRMGTPGQAGPRPTAKG